MWCRAFLATIALTYIVCVLVMNGLQKEDLDVSTLRKLQRHNVNIDDMNNETLREECEATARSNTEVDRINLATLNAITSDISKKNEDLKINLSDSSLHNTIINYFNNVQKNSKPNESDKVKHNVVRESTTLPNVESFMDLWNRLSKTIQNTAQPTTKAIEFFTETATTSDIRSDHKTIEYINKIIEKLISIQKVTTTRPTTKEVDYGILAQKINEILANTNIKNSNKLKTLSVSQETTTDKSKDEIDDLHNDSLKNIYDLIKLTNPYKKFGPVSDNDNNKNKKIEVKNLTNQINKQYLIDEENQAYKNRGLKKQMKSISEDIIMQISESVKAKVLENWKIVITTEKPKKRTTVRTTTIRPRVETTTNTKLEAKDFLQFMEMFQKFKANKEITTTNKYIQDKIIKAENAPLIIAYPQTPYNMIIKPEPLNVTSVVINPFNPIQPVRTALSNEPFALLNINTPIQNLPTDAKPVHKITQLNIFNTKNNYHPSPITIQTNSVEIPPLGLPAQQSFVYQNIVVTTNHPIDKVRQENHRTQSYDEKYYVPNKHKGKNYYQPKDTHKDFGTSRHERNRDRNDRYFREMKHKPIRYIDFGRSHYNDRNTERFHERLENEDRPQITRSRESLTDDNDYSAHKYVSRHQLPLNDAKKRLRYDDSHFRNFLKTQQKVNDMLERILATKAIGGGPPSVETTV